MTFDELLGDLKNGLQLDTNLSSCHILLGHRGAPGINGRHCNITIDDSFCVWIHDHSTQGTAIGCNGQNQKDFRRMEKWILANSPNTLNRLGEITIHAGGLAVKIEFPNHAAAHPGYIGNLRAFVQKCKDAAKRSNDEVLAVDGLGLNSECTTQAPSEAQTPNDRLIYYHGGVIGRGEYGKVIRVTRARDGEVLAAKIFKPSPNKRKLDQVDPAWLTKIRREFTLMEQNTHVSASCVMPASTMTLIVE